MQRALILAAVLLHAPPAPAQENWEAWLGDVATALQSGPEDVRAAREELAEGIPRLEELALGATASEPDRFVGLLASACVLGAPDPPDEALAAVVRETRARREDDLGVARLAFEMALRLRASRPQAARPLLETAVEVCPEATSLLPLLRCRLSELAVLRADFRHADEQLASAEDGLEHLSSALGAKTPWVLHVEWDVAARRTELLLAQGIADEAARAVEAEAAVARRLVELGGDPETYEMPALVHRCACLLATDRAASLERVAREALDRGFAEGRASFLLHLAGAQAELGIVDPEAPVTAHAILVDLLASTDLDPAERALALAFQTDVLLGLAREDEARARFQLLRALLEEMEPAGASLDLYAAELGARLALDDDEAAPEAVPRLAAALNRFLASWRDAPRRSGGADFLRYSSRQRAVSTLMRHAMTREPGEAGLRAALEILYATQAHGQLVRFSKRDPGTLDDALSLLVTGERRGVLVYFPGRERTHLFAIDASGWTHHELAAAASLEEPRNELVAGLLNDDAPVAWAAVRRWGGKLGEELLPAELTHRLRGWREVTIVGSELLGYLPFELFPLASEDGSELLGDELAIGYLPTLPLAVHLDRRERARSGRRDLDLLVIAAPALDAELAADHPKLASLPFGAVERDALTGSFDEGRAEVRTGERAWLDPEALARARVLLLLTHGIERRGDARSAGLALAPSGPGSGSRSGAVFWEDIEALVDVPPLVVVSACRAGRGETRRGEDLAAHLGGAFLAAGAGTVVISPADLEYAATVKFDASFLERLRDPGDGPAEALRRARRALGGPADSHPRQRQVHAIGLAWSRAL